MPYTPPAIDAVNFQLEAITPPAINAVNFDIDPILSIADVTQAQTIENVVLTAHAPNWAITAQDVTQAQTAENVVVTFHPASGNLLVVDDITQAQVTENVILTAHNPQNIVTIGSYDMGGLSNGFYTPQYVPPVNRKDENLILLLLFAALRSHRV